MTDDETRIAAIVSRITHIPAAQLSPVADLRVDFNIDSLAGLQIIAAVEASYAIEVPEYHLADYTTIRDIAELAVTLSKEQAATDDA